MSAQMDLVKNDVLACLRRLKVKNENIQTQLGEGDSSLKEKFEDLRERAAKEVTEKRRKQEEKVVCTEPEEASGSNKGAVNDDNKPNITYKQDEICIKGLDRLIDNTELSTHFSPYGKLVDVRVIRDENDRSRGFAIIRFGSATEATRAIAKMNGKLLGSRQISVSLVEIRQRPGRGKGAARKPRFEKSTAVGNAKTEELPSKPDGQQPKPQPANSKNTEVKYHKDKLFVRNLAEAVDEAELKSHFIQFGNIILAEIKRDEFNKSKGFGFVQYFSSKAAEKARTEMNGRVIYNSPIFVSPAQVDPKVRNPLNPSKPKPVQDNKVFVRNLTGVDSAGLKGHFCKFGKIAEAHVAAEKKIGFVTFCLARDAARAIAEMNNKVVGAKPVKCSLAMKNPGTRPNKAALDYNGQYDNLYD